MNNNEKDIWIKSPITGKDKVLCEYDDTNGTSKMDLSSGYYTNEHPLNHKKYPDFDISEYEKNMPELIKKLRFDDGESYWYPATIQTQESLVFPDGTVQLVGGNGEAISGNQIKWCWAPIKQLTKEEKEKISDVIDYESKVDMKKAEYFINYLDACKKVKGFSLGNL